MSNQFPIPAHADLSIGSQFPPLTDLEMEQITADLACYGFRYTPHATARAWYAAHLSISVYEGQECTGGGRYRFSAGVPNETEMESKWFDSHIDAAIWLRERDGGRFEGLVLDTTTGEWSRPQEATCD